MELNSKFVVFEGAECSGKTTQVQLLVEHLKTCGVPESELVVTREPGGTALAEQIRNIVKTSFEYPTDALTELLLMMAARRSHLQQVILPALNAGKWVICDRYFLSTLTHQCHVAVGDILTSQKMFSMHDRFCNGLHPGITLFFDIDLATQNQRLLQRAETKDRFEIDADYRKEVIDCYSLAYTNYHDRHHEIVKIDGRRTKAEIQNQVAQLIFRYFERIQGAGIGSIH